MARKRIDHLGKAVTIQQAEEALWLSFYQRVEEANVAKVLFAHFLSNPEDQKARYALYLRAYETVARSHQRDETVRRVAEVVRRVGRFVAWPILSTGRLFAGTSKELLPQSQSPLELIAQAPKNAQAIIAFVAQNPDVANESSVMRKLHAAAVKPKQAA